jgi:phosphomannomutase
MLLLFDVDNTLTISRGKITDEMKEMLYALKNKYDLGVVSGSDFPKLKEQLEDAINCFTWVFSENGLATYFEGKLFSSTNIVQHLGEQLYGELINDCMLEMSKIKLPVKRGVFLELRTGLLNICPIGRSCSQTEREEFEKYDNEFKIRENLCNVLSSKYKNLRFSIGGQISIDVFPYGWDKTYCLDFIVDKYPEIYFYGDRICEGGNDYEIGNDKRVTKIHSVKNWKDTLEYLKKL